jgi:membrane protein YdbS with pleckstrin-like domain
VIFIVVLPSIVKIAIWIFSTKFIVSNSSIEYNYDFFSHKHNSFSVEKITKVIVTESLIDKLFNTCSVQFYSIGSSSAITFRNIKKTSDICDKLLSKVWIYKKEEVKSIPTNFNLIEFLKAHVFSSIFLIILLTGTIIGGTMNIIFFGIAILILAIIAIKYLYLTFYYSKRFYTNNLYKHFIESKKWIIIQKTHYALFRHIKTTHSTKNIWTTVWNISLNVSGEQMAEKHWNKDMHITKIFTSNSININYIKQSHIVVNLFDSIYLDRELDNSEVLSSKPIVKNSIFWIWVVVAIIILISFIITFAVTWTLLRIELLSILWVLALILIPIIGPIIWGIKVMKYSFQKDRVIYSSGIFYKKILSIPYIRFNFIENDTWFVNKIFGNWNVWIFTIWSGKKELNVKNIKNYTEVYNLLKKD